jgi:tetratricopeptide (TPR) repeat protein
MCVWEWKWEQGLELLRKAILLQPSFSLGQQTLRIGLTYRRQIRRSRYPSGARSALDPLSIRSNRSLGVAHYLRGCGAVAQRWFDAAIALQPESAESYFLLARLHLQHRNYTGALDAALKSIPVSSARTL